METYFIPNPAINESQVKDAIHGQIIKTKSILTCAMFSIDALKIDPELADYTLYHALWAADDCVEKIALLVNRLEKLVAAKTQQNLAT